MKKFIISFCLILFALNTWGQTREIKGQIKGPDQQPIPGVTIIQDGTQNGTVTDDDGNYSLQIPDSGTVVLTASYTGYSDQKIVVGEQSEYNIAMDTEKADEVVVIGYGTVKKSDLTGSVSSLKPDDVKEVPSGSVIEAIQGKAAGVDITRTSGEAGKAPNVVIRGTRSIAAGNGPLYIVDGVQYGNPQDINPNDIASMEVLKDASATAIYGSRGANGVIIITTKKGKSGDGLKVFLNTYAGVSSPLAYPKAMTAQEYADLRLEAAKVGNPNATYQTALSSDEYDNYVNGVSTDYTDLVLHNGSQKNIQIGVAGGTDKLRSYFSLDYFNEKGLLLGDELDRYSGRFNLDYDVAKFLKIGTQTQVTYYDKFGRNNVLGNASKISPLTTVNNPDGSLDLQPNDKHANPLLDEQPNTAENLTKTLRIFPTIYAELRPFKNHDFTARTNLAINWDNRSQGIFNSATSYQIVNSGASQSRASHDAQARKQLNWQGILNYNKTINENHSFGVTALSEIITNKTEQFYVEALGQLIPEQLYYNLGDNMTRSISSKYTESSLVSFAGRVNYSFKSKYLLTLTGRTDGASVLAEGNKWDFFPSVAAGWKISDEKFMDFQKVFNAIKLRGSWGVAGNSNIDPYSTQSNLYRVPFSYDVAGVTAYTFSPLIGNTSTAWEKSSTIDFGLDFGMYNDRITASIDYYDTKTRDLLLAKNLPLSTGVTKTIANVGRTSNKGIELTLTSVNIDKKNFVWTTTVTFMRNKERVEELSDGQTIMQVTDPDGSNARFVVVGQPVNSYYDYEKIGIWQTSDAEAIAAHNALNAGYQVQPGKIRIKDQNGDGIINPDDRTVVGNNVPKWSAGFNSEFKFFNSLDISFFLFARMGHTINYQYAYNPTNGDNSLSTREYWTPENPTNDLPRPGLTYENTYANSINYVDGSFLKLRSFTVGYSVPSKISSKFGMSRLRVYVTGKNLLVFSKIKSYDPEMEGNLTFPTVKLFVGGINIEF